VSPEHWRRTRRVTPDIDGPRREALLALDVGEVRFAEPLAAWTALHIGGPAEALVRPRDTDGWGRVLNWCRQQKILVTTIGTGLGLVVREGGVRGVTVVTAGLDRVGTLEQPGWSDAGWDALAGAVGKEKTAGAPVSTLAQAGVPLACLEGVGPVAGGTIGGALRRVGGELRDRLAAVAVVGDRGRTRVLVGDQIDVSGNRLQIPRRAGLVAVAWRGAVKTTIDPVAGSSDGDSGKIRLFRDPEGTTASSVVQSLDLQGIRLREVVIDPEDPNQIGNKGGGTATEVVALARYLKERAAKDAGVKLVECYRVIGKK
jgi:UDP-N-acetylmuramate dehydrogenase